MQETAADLAAYLPGLDNPPVDRPLCAVVAGDLHDYFTAAEALFERVAGTVDGSVPAGEDSRAQLVDQMAADLGDTRGPLLNASLRAWLHELRRFRHFFRHAYAVALDPTRLAHHADRLAQHHPVLVDAIEALETHIRHCMAALQGD